MKNNKGFTLIELMIAIAIIGILALVLIPRVAGVKDQARESGLDTNTRMAAAIAEGLLDRFGTEEADCDAIETALAAKIAANKIANPFSKSEAVLADNPPTAGQASFVYDAKDGAIDEINEAIFTAVDDVLYPGVILYDAYVKDGKLYVTFTPIGSDGKPVPGKKVTTN